MNEVLVAELLNALMSVLTLILGFALGCGIVWLILYHLRSTLVEPYSFIVDESTAKRKNSTDSAASYDAEFDYDAVAADSDLGRPLNEILGIETVESTHERR